MEKTKPVMVLISEEDLKGLQERKKYLEREISFLEERSKDSEALKRAKENAAIATEAIRDREALKKEFLVVLQAAEKEIIAWMKDSWGPNEKNIYDSSTLKLIRAAQAKC